MPQISRPTIRRSLLAALARVRELALMWFTTPPAKDKFENLEPRGFTAMCALALAQLPSLRRAA